MPEINPNKPVQLRRDGREARILSYDPDEKWHMVYTGEYYHSEERGWVETQWDSWGRENITGYPSEYDIRNPPEKQWRYRYDRSDMSQEELAEELWEISKYLFHARPHGYNLGYHRSPSRFLPKDKAHLLAAIHNIMHTLERLGEEEYEEDE